MTFTGRIHITGIHEDGDTDRTCSMCVRSSSDIHADVQCMTAALELRDAIRRGVNITPEQFYKHVVGDPFTRPYCLLLSNCKCTPEVGLPDLRSACDNWRTG